ncbi:hypothetical protein Tsubulata_020582 [Turnera subulata]|uniref:cysteine--tRNA ligase n=1 Tax=Turnera subulata TaxID=218843 RepID=A0A9Q0G9R8_9ROSI|nr:hypothetical protein Tsubulata_020582 [Turnera subulata]
MAKEEEEFRIYNTLTKEKDAFKTVVPGKVGMYVCGVTAYDFSHIGHARAAVSFDVLYRYLLHLGYEVTYVRNFTDIDDKIIRRANEIGEDPLSLSSRFCNEYKTDMAALQCLDPTHEPKVTENMEQIKDMISQIINNGFAYTVEGDVFFAVDKSPNYGKLSGQDVNSNRAGERVAVDSRKQNPADFALWKAAKPGEKSWESPWGPGRPGWHIECSAMSARYLTFKFDIHGGGIDLIFPHHENEIAQSCAACQESNISYWMHNGHVNNKNEKMSKSLGNFFTIRQITERYHPLALRHFLLSAHYRSPLNYSVSQLEEASEALFSIYQTLQDCEDALLPFEGSLNEGVGQNGKVIRITSDAQICITKLREEFEMKMKDDLQTAHLLTGALQGCKKFINSSLSSLKKKQQKQQQLSLIQSLREVKKEIETVLKILGLLPHLGYAEILKELKGKALNRAGMEEADVLNLIKERTTARKERNFSRSDEIREDLAKKGIELMDVGNDTVWKPCIVIPVVQEETPEVIEQQKPPASESS